MKKFLVEDSYNLKWVSFYPKFNTSLYVEKAGYFDERPVLHTSVTQIAAIVLIPILTYFSLWALLLVPFIFFGWGKLRISLPIHTGIQDCDSAAWGFDYHNNTAWFYIGGGGNMQGGAKYKTIHMPWELQWVRTSTLLKNGDWFHETEGKRIRWDGGDSYGGRNWLKANQWQETHPFLDKYDNTIVNATIIVTEDEHRPRGAKWTSLFGKIGKHIMIEFDQEVGEGKGSWKGGTLGCGYKLLPNETPLECLKRMEKERKF